MGVLAAALGFFAGRSDVILPGGSDPSDAIAALETKLSDQTEQIAALTKSVTDGAGLADKVNALTSQIDPVASELDALKASVDGLAGKIDPLTSRLTDLESGTLTQGASPETTAAFEAELKKLQESLTAQRAEVEKMVADAQALEAKAAAEARAATNAAILSRLHGQLDAGQPYADLVAELQAGGLDVPDALTSSAANGVSTVAALQESFTPAARVALAAAREADKGSGLVAFLQRQTGARSVTPKDGDDPDAILSRAQAALADGDIATTLTELKSLPQDAQPALADWEQAAQTRVSAVAAAHALGSSANSN